MSDHRKFAISTAKEAGEILMKNYGKMQRLNWEHKTSFKTKVDDLSDTLIRKRIIERFPEHNILSEESNGRTRGSEFTWVIDPLDGTINYTYGITDHFSVCIALAKEKSPILGVIYAPKRGELYVAEKGKGAVCNGKPISVSLEENINHVLMELGIGKETESFKRTEIAQYTERAYSPDGVLCCFASGCASVPLCLVASGKLHAYMALSLEPWDMAAAVILNREAGAKVTNIRGEKWTLDDRSILVANPKLHKDLFNLYFLNNKSQSVKEV